jgi:hypothetical protein
VYFFADTTGSMGPALATVKCNALAILNTIKQQTTSPRFGAGDYKDFQSVQQDPYAFNNNAPLPAADDNGAAALTAIGQNVDTPCLPTTAISSQITGGGAPNFADTYVTPYVATKAGQINGWRAQFAGGRLVNGSAGVPAGVQIKVLRKDIDNPNLLRVMSAGTVHDPRPVLQARFSGYPFFQTQDSAIEFTESAGLDLLAGDLVGLTIKSDPQAGAYFYPMVSRQGTRMVTRDENPPAGTIDLTDPFTASPPDAPALQVNTNNGWSAFGGHDRPEGQLFGLQQIASPTQAQFDIKWRNDSTRILVWMGDEPGHDPICAAISGETSDITETTATNSLTGAGVKVIAASLTTGSGLDGPPADQFSNDYVSKCGPPGGTAGQATRITNATGGVFTQNVEANDVARAILDGLHNLPATVKPQVVADLCSSDLAVTFAPTTQTVTSGTATEPFTETVQVASNASNGHKTCTIEFLVNGKRVTLPDESPDPAFRQLIAVDVGRAEVTVQAQSANPDSVVDFLYQCSPPVYPIAVAVKRTRAPSPNGSGGFDLTYQATIDGTLVPGGNCKVTAVISDFFLQSDRNDPAASTQLNVTRTGPRDVTIYTPVEGALFTSRQTIPTSGWGTSPQGGALTFRWAMTGPGTNRSSDGATTAFQPSGQWALGQYLLTLRGTDLEGNFQEATSLINVVQESALPQVFSFDGFFSPVKNWPTANQVNGGQASSFKWRLADRFGNQVTQVTSAVLGAQLQQVDCVTRDAVAPPVIRWPVGATQIRFDDKQGQFVGNPMIPTGVGNCYVWTLALTDGGMYPIFLQVTK